MTKKSKNHFDEKTKNVTRTCYFYNVGVKYDKDDLELLEDIFYYNKYCTKSDLCNGLYCEDYGLDFDEKEVFDYIKQYVEEGVPNTYGFMKKVNVTLPIDTWNRIYEELKKDYDYNSIDEASQKGFISKRNKEIYYEHFLQWENPDFSYLKDTTNNIVENKLNILKEEELNPDTISWINENLYNEKTKEIE